METIFTSDGKFMVVAVVIAIIFIGIVIYLYRLDVSIKKLENKQ